MFPRFSSLFLALLFVLPGCAAMREAHEKAIDESVSVTHGAQLGNYRRVGIETIECVGQPCTPALEASMTRLISKAMTDACYGVVETEEFTRYSEYFSRRLERLGRPGMARNPQGGRVRFPRLEAELREALVEELQLDAVLTGTLEIGQPDETTHFRPVVVDLNLIGARTQETVWRGRMQGNILDENEVSEGVTRTVTDLAEGIRRKASLCNLTPVNTFEGIELLDREIRLRERIFFQIDSDQLTGRSAAVLDRLAAFLQAHSELKQVRIEGHTDDVGEDAYNLELSSRRAKSVMNYLVSKGVDPRRLEAQGFGEQQPLVPNNSEANRARNRRVEFKVGAPTPPPPRR